MGRWWNRRRRKGRKRDVGMGRWWKRRRRKGRKRDSC
jgi:hypothetical protein